MSVYEGEKKPNKKVIAIIAVVLVAIIVVVGVVLALKNNSAPAVEETTLATTDTAENKESIKETKPSTTKEDVTVDQGYGDAYKSAVNKFREEIEEEVNGDLGVFYYGPYPIYKNSTVNFAIEDLNGDSVPELIIGKELDSGKIDVLNIMKYSNGEAVDLFEDQIIGKRMSFEICCNGYFKVSAYTNDGSSMCTFYKYDETSSAPYIVGSVGAYGSVDGSSDVIYAKSDKKLDVYEVPSENLIDQEEYNSILNQYKPIEDLEWEILYTE